MWVQSLGGEDHLEEGMATHSSLLAWKIPWTEEPGGLQSMGSQSWTQLRRLSTCRIFYDSYRLEPCPIHGVLSLSKSVRVTQDSLNKCLLN